MVFFSGSNGVESIGRGCSRFVVGELLVVMILIAGVVDFGTREFRLFCGVENRRAHEFCGGALGLRGFSGKTPDIMA